MITCRTQNINQQNNNSDFFYKRALPFGVLISASSVALRAYPKENRCDTFVKTAKNVAKIYTKENKATISSFFKDFFGAKNFGNWVEKVGNKKMFAFLFISGALVEAGFINALYKLFNPKK